MTSTYSGLSVPDWPTTFGQNMFTFPPSMMKGGIFYEHGHRLFASLVGFLTIGNSLALWIWDRRRWLQWTGVFALLLVIVQGVLGGMTVRYKLPMPVSAAHACVAELFLCITVLMAFALPRPGFSPARVSGKCGRGAYGPFGTPFPLGCKGLPSKSWSWGSGPPSSCKSWQAQ